MEQHIAAGCPEPATTISKPIYTNSCNVKGCKNRSAIPIICQKCRLNYCLKHRLEGDHSCSTNINGTGNGANGSGSKPPAANGPSSHNNWSQKVANARNARSSAAAAAATNRQNQNNQSKPSNASSGKKGKDKCLIS
ncbi:zinc finger, AN1-type domain [Haplosporangium bisporale]|nr:zinc finger, AN1-type domain [Haplosporangium bisporale]